MIKYSSVGSAVAFSVKSLRSKAAVQARSAQFFVFERSFPVILRILMYGEVDKINLARHYFQIGIIFCAKINNNITVKKSSWYSAVGIIVVHLFIELQ